MDGAAAVTFTGGAAAPSIVLCCRPWRLPFRRQDMSSGHAC
ncbi:hypothetical protein BTHE_1695 [Bifidobacterium thermophilum]|nr:hypothetical protein BTHE_1695 [Bifidobacterium thermophilum]